MTGCTWAPNHRKPGQSCHQPGQPVRVGCTHEHIYTAVMCPGHRDANLMCYACATGPTGHKCPLAVLVEAT